MNIYGDLLNGSFSLHQNAGMPAINDEALVAAQQALVVLLCDNAEIAECAERAVNTLSHEWIFGFGSKPEPIPDGGVATFFWNQSIEHGETCRSPGLHILDMRMSRA